MRRRERQFLRVVVKGLYRRDEYIIQHLSLFLRMNSILFRLEPNNDLKCVVGLHNRRAASSSCEFVISSKYGEESLDRHKTIPDRRKRRSGYTPRRVLGCYAEGTDGHLRLRAY